VAAIFAFKCKACRRVHEGSPSFSYPHPLPYMVLTDDQKRQAKLTSDLCTLSNGRGTHRFALGSLSEQNFKRYLDTWDDPDENDSYFGWFCNRLPYYPDTMN